MDYINYQPTFDNYTFEDGGEEMELEITAIEFALVDFDERENNQVALIEDAARSSCCLSFVSIASSLFVCLRFGASREMGLGRS